MSGLDHAGSGWGLPYTAATRHHHCHACGRAVSLLPCGGCYECRHCGATYDDGHHTHLDDE